MSLSLLYGLPDLRMAFSGPYVVQNDARQHVFWMERFRDPGLFPNDLIADYYQAVAPPGYALLYRAAATAGMDPLVFSKVLPLGLAVLSAAYAFALTGRLLGSPAAAFLASVFLSQHLWLTDDLPSGTPHAFAVPLLAAFLYYRSRRSLIPYLVVLALQGLFYPQILLVSCGTLVLGLVRFGGGRLRVTRDRRDLVFCAAGLAVAALSLVPFALETSSYGPTITAAEARQLPQFFRGGRSRFFDRTPWQFWMVADRSGLMAKFFAPSGTFIAAAPLMLGGLLLPALLAMPRRFPLAARVSPDVALLGRVAASSLVLFAAAHALLFKLHLPSRYSMFSARAVLAVAGALAWMIVGDAVRRWLASRGGLPRAPRSALLAAGLAAAAAFLVAPLFQKPAGDYVVGAEPEVYRFFAGQPPDILVASISPEAQNLPTFARRSVLVSYLHSVPYQLGYFRQIERRATDLIRAEYAEDPGELRAFLRAYGVDFVLLDRWSFRPRTLTLDSWVRQYRPLADRLAARLEAGAKPALEVMAERCTVLGTERTLVVDARCLLEGA
jgi:hypothetical protein